MFKDVVKFLLKSSAKFQNFSGINTSVYMSFIRTQTCAVSAIVAILDLSSTKAFVIIKRSTITLLKFDWLKCTSLL